MIDENKYAQYGFKREIADIKGITIHNTNIYNKSALDLFNWLNNENKDSIGCHYLVDYDNVIEVMPDDWAVYHINSSLDYGNYYTIAIEICSNLDNNLYLQGQDKAIELIKNLLEKYNLTPNEIYFHNDFDSKSYCPATILDIYKKKRNFINKFFGKE